MQHCRLHQTQPLHGPMMMEMEIHRRKLKLLSLMTIPHQLQLLPQPHMDPNNTVTVNVIDGTTSNIINSMAFALFVLVVAFINLRRLSRHERPFCFCYPFFCCPIPCGCCGLFHGPANDGACCAPSSSDNIVMQNSGQTEFHSLCEYEPPHPKQNTMLSEIKIIDFL